MVENNEKLTLEDIERHHKSAVAILRDLENVVTKQKEEFQIHIDRINGLRFILKQLERLKAMDEAAVSEKKEIQEKEE
jgi:hypothetical protein